MPFSTYLDDAILNEIFGGTAYPVPATVYIGLSTSTPTQAGGNFTEPALNNYGRVAVTNNTTNFPVTATGTKANATVIAFPTPSGAWGTATYFGIFDALTGGNLLGYGLLTVPVTIASGVPVSFPIGALTISES